MKTLTAQQAAKILALNDSRVRQLCIASHRDPTRRSIGEKHGHLWSLTAADVSRLQRRTDGRKKQKIVG